MSALPTFNSRAWWLDEGMTAAEDVAAAARERGAFRGLSVGDFVGMADVPLVRVEAHGGPWLIYPDPLSVLGWVAEQIEPIDDHGEPITVVDEDGEPMVGWLGCGDLKAARIVGNLLDSDRLPVDLHLREPFISTRHLRAPQPAELDRDVVEGHALEADAAESLPAWLGQVVFVAERAEMDDVALARFVRHAAAAASLVTARRVGGAS